MSPRRARRRGFTLPEMIIAMVILSLIGGAIVRILVLQTHLFQKATAQRATRVVTRSALNVINSDLRMLEARNGIVSASNTALLVRAPYALGIVCGAGSGGSTIVSLAPVDSTAWANAGLSGYAWRDSTGVYHYQESGVTITGGDANVCTTASITTLANGKVIAVQPALPLAATIGTPVFFEEQVKYEFKSSVGVPGAIGLWRTTVATSLSEELVTPFTNSAGFKFFVLDADTAQAVPPSPLSNIRGIEFVLTARSETAPGGEAAPESTLVNTAVFFRNSLN
jgi:prepilin-type N-terminal cleavage/methylation domain-containing protein